MWVETQRYHAFVMLLAVGNTAAGCDDGWWCVCLCACVRVCVRVRARVMLFEASDEVAHDGGETAGQSMGIMLATNHSTA